MSRHLNIEKRDPTKTGIISCDQWEKYYKERWFNPEIDCDEDGNTNGSENRSVDISLFRKWKRSVEK